MENFGWVRMKRSRAYGLMAGITIGFAVWGSVRMTPIRPQAAIGPWIWEMPDTSRETAGAAATEQLELHALSAVLMDGDSGRILYGKEAEVFRPMASTTKIMTCILALEQGSLKAECTVSPNAAAQPKVHLGAPQGSRFYLRDLLYSLMLESHNDAAVMIAEQVGGSVEGFAAMMNQKARDIGCTDTWFITPNGLDASYTAEDGTEYTHGTTAADLAAIMRYCIRESPMREEFLAITRTQNYSFSDLDGKRTYSCSNHNAFLQMMDGALTGKTGFTGGAGYSYVAAWQDGERTFVAALLGSGWPPHKTYKWADTRKLFDFGRTHYAYRDVYREPDLEPIAVREGLTGERIPLTLNLKEEQKHLRLLLKEEETVTIQTEVPDYLEAPVEEGDGAGYVRYMLDGETVGIYPVYTGASMERWNFPWCLKRIFKQYFV